MHGDYAGLEVNGKLFAAECRLCGEVCERAVVVEGYRM